MGIKDMSKVLREIDDAFDTAIHQIYEPDDELEDAPENNPFLAAMRPIELPEET